MAISFSLDLTPNQIEFLQGLDLYADGAISILEVGRPLNMDSRFCTHVGKLIREGLVAHVDPEPGKTRYEGQVGGGVVIQAYRITDKGRAVLGLIEQDVKAFLARQKDYVEAKRNGRKKPA